MKFNNVFKFCCSWTKGFQSHHKEDCVLHAHAHVAVELSVLAITGIYKLFMPSKILREIILCMLSSIGSRSKHVVAEAELLKVNFPQFIYNTY
jgi:hypothetical protein